MSLVSLRDVVKKVESHVVHACMREVIVFHPDCPPCPPTAKTRLTGGQVPGDQHQGVALHSMPQ